MEPLTTATAFATVVSLIGQFKTERGTASKTDTDAFLLWLNENRHEEISKMLEMNTNATISIKALLNYNQELLIERLESIDNALALYASALPEFTELVNSLKPNSKLSKQALSILKELNDSGGSKILEGHSLDGIYLHILNGKSGQITISDQRFIEDDLNKLVMYGFFRQDYNGQGQNIYLMTREAADFASALNNGL